MRVLTHVRDIGYIERLASGPAFIPRKGNMKIREAMTRDPVTRAPTTPLRLVATVMADHDCAAVPIVDAGEVVGIVTVRLHAYAVAGPSRELPASSMRVLVMAQHPRPDTQSRTSFARPQRC